MALDDAEELVSLGFRELELREALDELERRGLITRRPEGLRPADPGVARALIEANEEPALHALHLMRLRRRGRATAPELGKPQRVEQWWQSQQQGLQPGTGYLMGQPFSEQQCLVVLRSGTQRQRRAAASLLARYQPTCVLFATDAPARRQKRLLGC